MSFKNIGKNIGKYDKALAAFKGMSQVKGNEKKIKELVEQLNKSSNVREAQIMLESANVSREVGRQALNNSRYGTKRKNNRNIQNAIANLPPASQIENAGVENVNRGFKNLLSTLNPLTISLGAVSAAIAAIAAFKWADDKFTLTYSTAEKHLAESSANYSQTTQEIANLDSQLASVQNRISELQAQPHLTFTDQAELAALQRQEQSLQNQLTLKQNLANIQMQKAASDAGTKTEWKTEKSESEHITTSDGHADTIVPIHVELPQRTS